VASWNVAAPLEAPAAPRPRPRPARRARTRRRFAGGVAWIAFSAVLLGGVVALNVAVLRLNVQLDRLGRERADLKARNALLGSQVSSAAASARIQALARTRLGLVPADPALTTYVELGGRGR
jgi:cell division protein FtsL